MNLPGYFAILHKTEKPKFQITKQNNLLDKKIEEARKILEKCEFCERKCKVNRLKGEKGFCKVGKEWKIFGSHTHMGEEPELVPSATLFLAGCTLRCCYCFLPETKLIINNTITSFEQLFKENKVSDVRNLFLKTITYKGKERKILRVFKHPYKGEIIIIKPHYFPLLKCTPEHKLFISEKPPLIKMIKASQITNKHYLVIPKISIRNSLSIIDTKKLLSQIKLSYKKSVRKLTPEKLREIIKLSKEKVSSFKIAKKFDMFHGYVRQLRTKFRNEYNFFHGEYKIKEKEGRVKFTFEKGRGIPRFLKITSKLSRLLGYYCAEGCVYALKDRPNSYRIMFTFGAHEYKYVEDIRSLLKEIFGIESTIVRQKSTIRIDVSSPSLGLFFKLLCGSSAKEKKVPVIINKTKKENIESFLFGYSLGDGWFGKCRKTDILSLNTISEKLALGIFWLFLKIGKIPRLYVWRPAPKKEIQGRIVSQSTLYYVKVRARNPNVKETNSYFFIPVYKILKENYKGDVYNMEVEGDHSYLANFVAVKNCQNAPDSVEPKLGKKWSDKEVAEWIDRKYEESCRNINFVTPDCYVWNILKVLKLVNSDIPVVWNSSSYYSKKTAELIKDVVDLYLLDFRYFNEKCAIKLSSAPNYVKTAKKNFLIANKNADLLARVLVLPSHVECCAKPILRWIVENLGKETRVNIMGQYRPVWKAYKFKEINRMLTAEEFQEVVDYAKKLGLRNLA